MQLLVWPQIKYKAIKETQTRHRLLQQSNHSLASPLAVFHTQASGSISVSNSDYTNFHQPSLRRVKLRSNLTQQTIISKPYTCNQPAMIQSMLRTYNASSQLISSVKRTFVESPNARKVMRVGMVNSFQLNSMETQGLPSANSPTPFHGKGPAV